MNKEKSSSQQVIKTKFSLYEKYIKKEFNVLKDSILGIKDKQ